MPELPVALTIAGFDSSAGAGLQADLLTFHNQGYHCLTAATAIVVETPLEVQSVTALDHHILQQQVALLLNTYPITAIKIGLLASPEQIFVLRDLLLHHPAPIVIDPVGISSTGTSLQQPHTASALLQHLAPLATLLTPNFPEAKTLLQSPQMNSPQEAALNLWKQTGSNILLTGGHHGSENEFIDLLIKNGTPSHFSAPAITSATSLHGTGCVLSSAIAAKLGQGEHLKDAIENARRYLRKTMSNHLTFPHSQPLLALNHHPSTKNNS